MARKLSTDWQTPERISSFVDGVLFVAMTILILTVDMPTTTQGPDGPALLAQLYSIMPQIFAYVASFLVIALYWIGYNTHFQHLERVDGTMLWFVILFLLLVGFVPFATSLMGDHETFISTAIYSGVMIGISSLLMAMSHHARRKGLFRADALKEAWLPTVLPWIKIIAVFSISIVVAAIRPDLARATYLLLVIPDGLFGRVVGIRELPNP